MQNVIKQFVPLAPEDLPGDPDLGGWRPFPRRLLKKHISVSAPLSALTLEQAVKSVAFTATYLCLNRAVQKLGTVLAGMDHSCHQE